MLSNDFLLFCWYIGQVVFSTLNPFRCAGKYNVDYSRRWKMTALFAECKVEIEIPLERLSDNVILRREPKNLEILRPALGGTQDDNYSLRGVYPERLDLSDTT